MGDSKKKIIITEATMRLFYEERDDSLERATTTATGLDAEHDRGVNIPRSGEDSLQLKKLMEFYTKLQQRVLDLENTKTAQAQFYKVGLSARIDSSNDEASFGDQEDASKQGRKIHDIDVDVDITLENVHDADMFRVHDLDGDEVFVETEEPMVNVATTTSTIPVSAAKGLFDVDMNLAQALAELKSTKTKAVTTAATNKLKKMKKKGLQGKRKKLKKLFAKSKKSLSVDAEKVHYLYTLGKKEKHFAAKRAEEKRNRPPTKAQQRNLLGLKDFKIFLELLLLRLCSLGSNSKWRFTSTRGTVDGVEKTYPPITAEEKLARKNELKVRGTVLMALLNEHQLKFNTYKCAKTLMEAIEKSESVSSIPDVATREAKTKPNFVGEPLIEDWISNSEDRNETEGNVTTAGPKTVVSVNKGYKANAVKASNCLRFGDKAIRSKHMTGNKSYLLDYEEIDGGFVAFGEDPKGGRITSKGKINTGKLDFEDVYFVKELKFNLFSVSQMCDRKNSVLFTDTECVVLSSDFKLLDEIHVLLRVLRKDNMYSVDLKNIVPLGDLTCLFAKATLDESNL
ncbi:hypothetical protein Tco_1215292 [Tanacetum coccineum]